MNKSKRLAPVLKLEEMKEQQAVSQYAQSRNQLAEETQKLEQLQQYSREYQDNIAQVGRAGVSAQRLQQYHHFLTRLDDAISQQQQQLELVRQQAEQQEKVWLQQRGATRNMDGLIQRYAQEEQLAQEKREQREMEERIANRGVGF